MLINYSNHPSSTWSRRQREMAQKLYGEVIDEAFPHIDPEWDEERLLQFAEGEFLRLFKKYGAEVTYHVMGELNFCHLFVQFCHKSGIRCVASTTVRDVKEKDGVREIRFHFVRFREYRVVK